MNGEPGASPAENRLAEHLELLRVDQPSQGDSLARRILRRARWQRAVRTPAVVTARLLGAMVSAAGGLLGGRARRR